MNRYMVIATFRNGTDMSEVFAVAPDEVARVEALRAEGRIGAVYLSLPRGTVFIEVSAADEADVGTVIGSLPMAKWWELDIHPITAPPTPGQ